MGVIRGYFEWKPVSVSLRLVAGGKMEALVNLGCFQREERG